MNYLKKMKKNKDGDDEEMSENNEEKRCIICNRPYNHHYDLFGRSCLANLYTQLNISNSILISNKEKHLCNVIARRNFKFFLSKEKKYALTENYIALDYLKRIDLKFTEDIKNTIKENIKRISILKKYVKSMLPTYSLNDFYKIYNDYIEFKKLLNENINTGKKDFDETALKGFSVIFDIDKIAMPLYYSAFYEMQRMFWEIVVMGGLVADMKLSSYLMRISLTNNGEYDKEDSVLTIEDENVNKILFDDDTFKKKINSMLEEDNVTINNKLVSFDNGDLLLALHDFTLNLKANKKENGNWNVYIEIIDKYDFTDIKNLKEYVSSTASVPMSIFSSTLNNFAAISSSYNVIKPFNFKLKIKNDDYKIENMK